MISLIRKETSKVIKVFQHPTFAYLTIIGNTILLSATTWVYVLERKINPQLSTFFDCLWWAVSTITTVAYGDRLPITLAGRIIAIGLMYTGTVLFITFTGVILTVLMSEEVSREFDPIEKEIKETEEDQIQIQLTMNKILHRLEQLEEKLPSSSHSDEKLI